MELAFTKATAMTPDQFLLLLGLIDFDGIAKHPKAAAKRDEIRKLWAIDGFETRGFDEVTRQQ